MISFAYAQSAGPAGGGLIEMLAPLAIMFLIFYFLLIRPQQKKAKDHAAVLKNLQRGDQVVTAGGLHGTVHGLTDQVVTLEVDDNCKVKVDRIQIARIVKGAA
ncbi:MAG: preprotein translocase subunit YajC [Deltaproteobacteria bacterium RIFCSPHIGHO2_02_FULL_40_11]|nr:MAG: preprotein translocase subunit YajC [Deltaproteobacteria bacterium RIFCSPHIGHO2_02_FULL_40_11]